MTNITFLVQTLDDGEALERTLASINELACAGKQIFVWKKQEVTEGYGFDGCSAWGDLNKCLGQASGDLIWLLTEGEELDWLLWQKWIIRLQADLEAICLLPEPPDFVATDTTQMRGAEFLFSCLVNLVAPGVGRYGLIFKNRGRALQVNPHLRKLGVSDLCFQLLRHGNVYFGKIKGEGENAKEAGNATDIDDWLILSAKYASLLRCLGSCSEYLHQLLVQRFLRGSTLQVALTAGTFDVHKVMALKEEFLSKIDCSPSGAKTLWNALCLLIGRDGLLLEQKLADESQYMVRSSEVKKHEEKLRCLLMSRSWKYTKWLRDLRQTIAPDPLGVAIAGSAGFKVKLSGSAYLHYLKTQIDTIHSSKSWFLTRPLRVWEAFAGEGDGD